MPNFYLPPDGLQGDSAVFPETEAHHIARVKRHQPGDIITAVDGLNTKLTIQLESVGKKSVAGRVIGRETGVGEPALYLALAQAAPKNHRLDLTIEKGVEIGISEFVPLLADRTVMRPHHTEHKVDRWQAMAIAAMKQCGRSMLPQIQPFQTLPEFLRRANEFDRVFVAHPTAEGRLAHFSLTNIKRAVLIIGPEGGFSDEELAQLQSLEKSPILFSLGERILRAETAGLIGAALLLYQDQLRL